MVFDLKKLISWGSLMLLSSKKVRIIQYLLLKVRFLKRKRECISF